MDIWGSLLVVLYITNCISAISLIFTRKADVGSTLAWLMVFLFLPVVGFILYFFFGSTVKYQWFYRQEPPAALTEAYSRALQTNRAQLKAGELPMPQEVQRQYQDMVRMNQTNAHSMYTADNNVELLVNAKVKYTRMFAEIRAAKKSIHVFYYIIKTRDKSGQQLLQLLEEKAREGVEVRVAYAVMGCLKARRRDFKPLERAGGMVYSHLPTWFSSLVSVNYQMHRKMVVIDGQVAYTGGINIGDDYLGLDKKRTPWRDTSIRLTGSSVRAVQLQFLTDWNYLDRKTAKSKAYADKVTDPERLRGYFPPLKETGRMGVQILASGPDQEYAVIKDSYLKMINSARRYVYIQTPYLVPDDALIEAMRLAARSGVDVRVMIPGIPDKKFVYYITLSHVEELLKNGIRVYTHEGFLHAKTFVLDDCIASVGSANFDLRSFHLDYELNAMVYDSTFAQQCRDTFYNDIRHSRELTLEDYQKRNWLQKICESFCRLVEPLA